MVTFADDTALLTLGDNIVESTNKFQRAVDAMNNWTKRWRIRFNETKSVHINFTNRRITRLPIVINSQVIPYEYTAKYLDMTLYAKLKWKEHVKKKVQELNIKAKKMHWLLGRGSEKLSVHNKLLLY